VSYVKKPDPRRRLPREPYPGLRPFLDFEAALLFGRERQVREVIERLAATQFVAVLGGSGSGKSSLIHAGVTPELRSFGIPGAGDLWLTMTCTPGTNAASQAAPGAARTHTPVTRLARRFATLLKSTGSEAGDANRQEAIAAAFRQTGGFARLLDAYAEDFDVPPGPDPKTARVMFVLDQFEEVFHPTNKGEPDAAVLVERVLDHFFDPHERCYVVLTMRSEHLNDCAAFLELPDAINKSSFLVRRLDTDELRQAIVGPAQRFLRLMARTEGEQRPLPEQVRFEQAVLERLLRDVSAITHDPDHLPLLQHLLARLWQAALEREEIGAPVPSHITEIDLVRAVNGSEAGADEEPLPESLNTLRACVDNWPEKLYLWHDAAQRAVLEALFRRLGFKDPNTGLYTQQRIDVTEAAVTLLGPGRTPADLKALVAEGFLGSVDYLFWDDEDPSRVTLKVSHESFIRGWRRFRALIDDESARFEEFLSVMRRCADWAEGARDDAFLLENNEMRRLAKADFQGHLASPERRRAWQAFLALDRDGARLAFHLSALDDFIGRSARRLARRVSVERVVLWSGVVFLLVGLIPAALFTYLIQFPTMRRAELLFDAGNRANRVTVSTSYDRVGATNASLDSLLRAAERVDQARSGKDLVLAPTSEWLGEHLQVVDPVRRQGELLDGLFAQSEPLVNGKLRGLLTGSMWRAAPRSDEAALEPPLEFADKQCSFVAYGSVPPGQEPTENPRGRLYVARGGAEQLRAGVIRRAVFVPERRAFDKSLLLYSATYDPSNQRCVLGPSIVSTPEAVDAYAVFDAGLRFFLQTANTESGAGGEPPSVIVQEFDWYFGRFGQVRALHRHPITVIADRGAAARVREAAGASRAAPLPSWRVPGGRAFSVGAVNWRLLSTPARALRAETSGPDFMPLEPAGPDSPCAQLAAGVAPPPGFRPTALDGGAWCVVAYRGAASLEAANDNPANTASEADEPPREEIRVALYSRPNASVLERLADNPPAPLAWMAPYARILPAPDEQLQWSLGIAGEHLGWLALRRPRLQGGGVVVIGAPLTTCAVWKLGVDLQRHNEAPVPMLVTPGACGV
jgi:hypothetical protein